MPATNFCYDCDKLVDARRETTSEVLSGANVPGQYAGRYTTVTIRCEVCGGDQVADAFSCNRCEIERAVCDDFCPGCMAASVIEANDYDPSECCWTADKHWREAARLIEVALKAKRPAVTDYDRAVARAFS